MTPITRSDLNDLAATIAREHAMADVAALAAGERLTATDPIAYLTGMSTIEDDIRAEWVSESEETVDAAIAESAYVLDAVRRQYPIEVAKRQEVRARLARV